MLGPSSMQWCHSNSRGSCGGGGAYASQRRRRQMARCQLQAAMRSTARVPCVATECAARAAAPRAQVGMSAATATAMTLTPPPSPTTMPTLFSTAAATTCATEATGQQGGGALSTRVCVEGVPGCSGAGSAHRRCSKSRVPLGPRTSAVNSLAKLGAHPCIRTCNLRDTCGPAWHCQGLVEPGVGTRNRMSQPHTRQQSARQERRGRIQYAQMPLHTVSPPAAMAAAGSSYTGRAWAPSHWQGHATARPQSPINLPTPVPQLRHSLPST